MTERNTKGSATARSTHATSSGLAFRNGLSSSSWRAHLLSRPWPRNRVPERIALGTTSAGTSFIFWFSRLRLGRCDRVSVRSFGRRRQRAAMAVQAARIARECPRLDEAGKRAARSAGAVPRLVAAWGSRRGSSPRPGAPPAVVDRTQGALSASRRSDKRPKRRRADPSASRRPRTAAPACVRGLHGGAHRRPRLAPMSRGGEQREGAETMASGAGRIPRVGRQAGLLFAALGLSGQSRPGAVQLLLGLTVPRGGHALGGGTDGGPRWRNATGSSRSWGVRHPSTAKAVVFNVTSRAPTDYGNLRLYRRGPACRLAASSTGWGRLGAGELGDRAVALSGANHLAVRCDMVREARARDLILDVTGSSSSRRAHTAPEVTSRDGSASPARGSARPRAGRGSTSRWPFRGSGRSR